MPQMRTKRKTPSPRTRKGKRSIHQVYGVNTQAMETMRETSEERRKRISSEEATRKFMNQLFSKPRLKMPLTTQNENLKMLNAEIGKNVGKNKMKIKNYLYRPRPSRKTKNKTEPLGIKI